MADALPLDHRSDASVVWFIFLTEAAWKAETKQNRAKGAKYYRDPHRGWLAKLIISQLHQNFVFWQILRMPGPGLRSAQKMNYGFVQSCRDWRPFFTEIITGYLGTCQIHGSIERPYLLGGLNRLTGGKKWVDNKYTERTREDRDGKREVRRKRKKQKNRGDKNTENI